MQLDDMLSLLLLLLLLLLRCVFELDEAQRPAVTALGFKYHCIGCEESFDSKFRAIRMKIEQPLITKSHLNSSGLITLNRYKSMQSLEQLWACIHSNTFGSGTSSTQIHPMNTKTHSCTDCIQCCGLRSEWKKNSTTHKSMVNYNSWTNQTELLATQNHKRTLQFAIFDPHICIYIYLLLDRFEVRWKMTWHTPDPKPTDFARFCCVSDLFDLRRSPFVVECAFSKYFMFNWSKLLYAPKFIHSLNQTLNRRKTKATV